MLWWPLLAGGLMFVALGSSLLARRCWGVGLAAVGSTMSSFCANLTPLFAALLSALWLQEPPRAHRALAFGLIVAGVVVSSRWP